MCGRIQGSSVYFREMYALTCLLMAISSVVPTVISRIQQYDFYRRFLPHYATLAAPLILLLRSTKFTWSTEADTTFTILKKKMPETLVSALEDFSKVLVVETDASAVAIGVVLSQEGHPLAFFSKKMCGRMQGSSVYVREMYALTSKNNQVADALSRKYIEEPCLLMAISSAVPTVISRTQQYVQAVQLRND